MPAQRRRHRRRTSRRTVIGNETRRGRARPAGLLLGRQCVPLGRCRPARGQDRSCLVSQPLTSGGGSAADVPPSAAPGAAVEPGRSLQWIQRPGIGRGGWPGWRSGWRAANKAQRCARNAGQFVKRASFTRSVKETTHAIPGHGNGPLSQDRRRSRPDLAVRHCDEGAALIAAFASEPARRPTPQSGTTLRASADSGEFHHPTRFKPATHSGSLLPPSQAIAVLPLGRLCVPELSPGKFARLPAVGQERSAMMARFVAPHLAGHPRCPRCCQLTSAQPAASGWLGYCNRRTARATGNRTTAFDKRCCEVGSCEVVRTAGLARAARRHRCAGQPANPARRVWAREMDQGTRIGVPDRRREAMSSCKATACERG